MVVLIYVQHMFIITTFVHVVHISIYVNVTCKLNYAIFTIKPFTKGLYTISLVFFQTIDIKVYQPCFLLLVLGLVFRLL